MSAVRLTACKTQFHQFILTGSNHGNYSIRCTVVNLNGSIHLQNSCRREDNIGAKTILGFTSCLGSPKGIMLSL